MRTSVGYKRSSNLEVIAAIMIIGLRWLAILFWTINAGRVLLISAPIVGSKLTR
jgi:hypothetical protein